MNLFVFAVGQLVVNGRDFSAEIYFDTQLFADLANSRLAKLFTRILLALGKAPVVVFLPMNKGEENLALNFTPANYSGCEYCHYLLRFFFRVRAISSSCMSSSFSPVGESVSLDQTPEESNSQTETSSLIASSSSSWISLRWSV